MNNSRIHTSRTDLYLPNMGKELCPSERNLPLKTYLFIKAHKQEKDEMEKKEKKYVLDSDSIINWHALSEKK